MCAQFLGDLTRSFSYEEGVDDDKAAFGDFRLPNSSGSLMFGGPDLRLVNSFSFDTALPTGLAAVHPAFASPSLDESLNFFAPPANVTPVPPRTNPRPAETDESDLDDVEFNLLDAPFSSDGAVGGFPPDFDDFLDQLEGKGGVRLQARGRAGRSGRSGRAAVRAVRTGRVAKRPRASAPLLPVADEAAEARGPSKRARRAAARAAAPPAAEPEPEAEAEEPPAVVPGLDPETADILAGFASWNKKRCSPAVLLPGLQIGVCGKCKKLLPYDEPPLDREGKRPAHFGCHRVKGKGEKEACAGSDPALYNKWRMEDYGGAEREDPNRPPPPDRSEIRRFPPRK